MMDSPQVKQLSELFSGYDRAHGRYEVKRVNTKGKNEGKAVTHREPVTLALWEAHMAGVGPGLGIIPLREDDTVVWGCIDVDVYPLKLDDLERRVAKLGLPLVICRTKSGGAHCFVFLSEPVEASSVVDALERWAAKLGYGGCEIFPKQTARHDDNDVGNWLNMPYYHAEMTNRYAIKNGEQLELDAFLDHAEQSRVGPGSLTEDPTVYGDAGNDRLAGGPPCLQTLAENGGLPDGSRNDGLFNVGVYLRKRFPDNWKDKLVEYNIEMCNPPLPVAEVNDIAKSLTKQDYQYRCRKAPISAYCNRRSCLSRDFGVGREGGLVFGQVTKFCGDEILWYLSITDDKGDHRMCLRTDEFLDQRKFRLQTANVLNRVPPMMKQEVWDQHVNAAMSTCTVIDPPDEATVLGRFRESLLRYASSVSKSTSSGDLLVSTSPHLTGDGEVWFRLEGLEKYLHTQGHKPISRSKLVEMLGACGCENKQKRIGKKGGVHIWIMRGVEQHEDGRSKLLREDEMGTQPF